MMFVGMFFRNPCRTPLASKKDAPLFVPGCDSVDPLQIRRRSGEAAWSHDTDDDSGSLPDAHDSKVCDTSDDGDVPYKDSNLSDATASTRFSSAGSEAGLSTPAWSEFEDDFMDCFSGSPAGKSSFSESTLKAPDDSWVGRTTCRRQKQTVNADKQVARLMKSILNKMTEENCPRLSRQLTQCIQTAVHVKTLISMIVEMATVQHNMINMYAVLLAILDKRIEQHLVGSGPKSIGFKRLLLVEFQKTFESVSEPPSGTDDKMMSKLRAIGCTKLIGALCMRGILDSSVFLAVLGELLTQGTPEALESLATLLTTACPVFDTPDFEEREAIESAFEEVEGIVGSAECDTRSRMLLTNVLDLRALGWKDARWH